jgi:hypothetical protein
MITSTLLYILDLAPFYFQMSPYYPLRLILFVCFNKIQLILCEYHIIYLYYFFFLLKSYKTEG